LTDSNNSTDLTDLTDFARMSMLVRSYIHSDPFHRNEELIKRIEDIICEICRSSDKTDTYPVSIYVAQRNVLGWKTQKKNIIRKKEEDLDWESRLKATILMLEDDMK